MKKVLQFVKGLWNYYVAGTWLVMFPPKNESEPGNEAKEDG